MLRDKNNNQGLVDGSALVHAVYQQTEAMESNGNACGATIATVPGILVTLAGKFTESQQTGHQGDNQKDLSSGRTIGKARECDGLYYYEDSAMENGQANAASTLGRSKLEPRAINCVFLGYSSTKHGYKCFDPISGETCQKSELEIEPESDSNSPLDVQGETCEETGGKHPVGCKWVFTVKYNPDGKVERYKARLVAKGFTQTFGIDYFETFAPVAKLNSMRIPLSLAVNFDWPLYQLDIKNAFLNGELVEEVYMELPPEFFDDQGNKKVCKLNKSLYGLKQSPRAWFGRFSQVLRRYGYSQGYADHTMFYKHSVDGKIVMLIVYVDDIILTGDDIDGLEKLKRVLANEFEVKDIGFLRYFLGMEVARTTQGIVVCQRKYTLDLLEETRMLGCKPIDTPVEVNKREGN
ncbi:Retrovirus-related Pol polyprotein from transposon RE2 [Vitis vinifera]|uniref:Retrovirus-related Pol polyprotein from transposon RE2 n=1 Tax=Vitis vinifera TaxID=29760 RepID=A0A438CX94_VITVI|nr:Retrovirus-related Pol polyprotein from transposon RE2 [Vitis vinifera]